MQLGARQYQREYGASVPAYLDRVVALSLEKVRDPTVVAPFFRVDHWRSKCYLSTSHRILRLHTGQGSHPSWCPCLLSSAVLLSLTSVARSASPTVSRQYLGASHTDTTRPVLTDLAQIGHPRSSQWSKVACGASRRARRRWRAQRCVSLLRFPSCPPCSFSSSCSSRTPIRSRILLSTENTLAKFHAAPSHHSLPPRQRLQATLLPSELIRVQPTSTLFL